MQMKKLVESSITPCKKRDRKTLKKGGRWGAQTAEGPAKGCEVRREQGAPQRINNYCGEMEEILNVTGISWYGGQCNPFRKSNSKNVWGVSVRQHKWGMWGIWILKHVQVTYIISFISLFMRFINLDLVSTNYSPVAKSGQPGFANDVLSKQTHPFILSIYHSCFHTLIAEAE